MQLKRLFSRNLIASALTEVPGLFVPSWLNVKTVTRSWQLTTINKWNDWKIARGSSLELQFCSMHLLVDRHTATICHGKRRATATSERCTKCSRKYYKASCYWMMAVRAWVINGWTDEWWVYETLTKYRWCSHNKIIFPAFAFSALEMQRKKEEIWIDWLTTCTSVCTPAFASEQARFYDSIFKQHKSVLIIFHMWMNARLNEWTGMNGVRQNYGYKMSRFVS